MNTPGTPLTAVVLGQLLGGLLLAAPPAYAQSAVSSFTPSVAGIVVAPAAETVSCWGQVKLTTTAVTDPTLPPGVVASIDARGLSCVGLRTGARYVNTGHANLTRLLVPNDVIKTTFALYKDVPGGFRNARTAYLTLRLSYDTPTGALTSAIGTLGNFP